MPGSNASYSSETSMCLSWEKGGVPSLGDTGDSVSLGDSNDVNDLSLGEDVVDSEVLLQPALGEVGLGLDGVSSVDLDLHDMGLLGVDVLEELWLGVDNDSDDGTVSDDSVETGLGGLGGALARVLGESLLLGLVPVLVEPSSEVLSEGAGPDSGEGSETLWSLDVSDDTDNLDRWGLDDGDSLDDLLLVESGVWVSDALSGDVSHTGLPACEGGEVSWLGSVILWERSDLASMFSCPLSWEESKVTVSWGFEFSV